MRLTGERLPWLEDEPASPGPRPEARAVAAKPTAGRAMWPWYLVLVLLIGAVAVGAWWLGTEQRDAAPPQLPAEEAVPIPVNRAPQGDSAGAPAAIPPLPSASEGQGATASAPRQPVRERPARPSPTPRSTAAERDANDAVRRPTFPADEPAIAPPPTGPTPVIVYHPNPNRGRVVQLGAFPTRAQAEDSWRRVTRRYPYLASKPKMVNTVDVRGLGGGRPTRMYRLQLGTSSQAQSAVICQQLERAGQSCVVVY